MRSVSMWQFIQNCLMELSKALWLGWREKKVCLVYGNRGMDLWQIAPGHKRLNPSHPPKENVASQDLSTEAELGFSPQRLIYFNQHLMTGHCQGLVLLGEPWRCQEHWLALVFASPAALPFSKFPRIY